MIFRALNMNQFI